MELLDPTAPAVGRSVVAEPRRHNDPVLADDRQQWLISCRDVANRERSLTVLVERGKVVLMGPPGEAAVLTASQLAQLRAALNEAADQAER